MTKLGPAGRQFANELADWLDSKGMKLDPQERVLCIRICKCLDRIDQLDKLAATLAAEDDAATYIKVVREERQQATAISTLAIRAGLPMGLVGNALKQKQLSGEYNTETGNVVPISAEARQRQRAAMARWANHEYSQRDTAKRKRQVRGAAR